MFAVGIAVDRSLGLAAPGVVIVGAGVVIGVCRVDILLAVAGAGTAVVDEVLAS